MAYGQKGNFVLAFTRRADGSLVQQGVFATGGAGAPVYGSHRPLILGAGGKWLIAANTGSNDVSVFQVCSNGLVLRSRAAAGTGPVSLALWNDKLLYVASYTSHDLNAFSLSTNGILSPLANSNRPLPGQYSSAIDLQFTPGGAMLTATDMVNRLVEMFPLDSGGLAGAPVTMPSAAYGPSGFTYGPWKTFYVAENGMGLPGAGTVSTYQYSTPGALQVLNSSLATTRTATSAVKVVISGHAYAINDGDGSISSFTIAPNGALTLLLASEASACAGAEDAAVSRDQRFLYVLSPSSAGICAYQIQKDGHLADLPFSNPLPYAMIQGIAAR